MTLKDAQHDYGATIYYHPEDGWGWETKGYQQFWKDGFATPMDAAVALEDFLKDWNGPEK